MITPDSDTPLDEPGCQYLKSSKSYIHIWLEWVCFHGNPPKNRGNTAFEIEFLYIRNRNPIILKMF